MTWHRHLVCEWLYLWIRNNANLLQHGNVLCHFLLCCAVSYVVMIIIVLLAFSIEGSRFWFLNEIAIGQWPIHCLHFEIDVESIVGKNQRVPATVTTPPLNVNSNIVLSLESCLTCVNGCTSTWSWWDSQHDFTDGGVNTNTQNGSCHVMCWALHAVPPTCLATSTRAVVVFFFWQYVDTFGSAQSFCTCVSSSLLS